MATIFRALLVAGLVAGLAACSATFRNHGYVPDETELLRLVVGVSTRDTVESTIGRPSTNGVERGDAWYYVQSRVRNYAWRAPQTLERQLVAVSFAENGTVANVERFGLERGRVVPLSRRVTTTSIREFGLIQQIVRNFGRLDIAQGLADG